MTSALVRLDGLREAVPLLCEIGDAKRVRVASAPGSLAEQAFSRAWARLAEGEDAEPVALSEAAAAVARARLALLLHAEPTLDHTAAARRLGKHPNWARRWRRTWATEGFRLTDRPGRGRKPAFPPAGGGDGQGAGLRAARAA